jgi:hypothetical protein
MQRLPPLPHGESRTRIPELHWGNFIQFVSYEYDHHLRRINCGRRSSRTFLATELLLAGASAKDEKGLVVLLVRPDGFVAWAADAEIDTTAAEQSVQRWFSREDQAAYT